MKTILRLILLFTFSYSLASRSVEKEVEYIISIMSTQTDSAILLSQSLLDYSQSVDDDYGIVQSNYILGYIHDKIDVNYGKSIIYYLEAIRYAEHADFENVNEKLISLTKNCGVVFRKFKAYDLAIEYYSNSLALAQQLEIEPQIISISYNLAGLYSDMGRMNEAINLLEKISVRLKPGDSKFFDVNNRLSQIYLESNQPEKASELAFEILSVSKLSDQNLIDTYQILGRVAISKGAVEEAEEHFHVAIESALLEKSHYTQNKALFESYSDLGALYYQKNQLNEALYYYSLAAEKITLVSQKPEYFRVFKSIANIYYHQGNFIDSKIYEDLYSESLNDYLTLQEEIQNTDKRYNMDLITKRYFDEVAKQEKIASILFYSKLISGSLLALLLLTIGFNWYQKVQLRKSIIKDLIDLQVLK